VATVLDLFAGGGGFSLGMTQAGHQVQRAVENHRPKAETYRANFPHVELTEHDIQDLVIRDAFDVVVGGPPCEPYTPANPGRQARPLDRLHRDRVGQLVLQFMRVAADVRPKAFVMENVVQVCEGPLRPELTRIFAEWGFPKLHFNELRAEDAGAPSHRLRMFVSDHRLDLPRKASPPPVREVLAGLPPPGSRGVANHEPHPLSPDKRARVQRLGPGQSLYSYTSATGKTHDNWLRLDGDKPCPTVLGNSRFIHPDEPRLLTPREHARLMGFPDDFVLKGGRDQQYDAVGEAVPPPLAKAIGLQIAAALGQP